MCLSIQKLTLSCSATTTYKLRLSHLMYPLACFINDLYSYQKEIEFENEIHNMVFVVERFLGSDRFEARAVVADLMAGRMRQFERIVAVEMPAMFEHLDLAEPVRRQLTRYAGELTYWMSGILRWHDTCDRYKDADLRRRFGRFSQLPTGLGTSAARLRRPVPVG